MQMKFFSGNSDETEPAEGSPTHCLYYLSSHLNIKTLFKHLLHLKTRLNNTSG
jgi:hypothetical protein